MIKEKIVAPDMTAAMKMIKERFGDEALILNSRTRHKRKPASMQLSEEVEVEIGLELQGAKSKRKPGSMPGYDGLGQSFREPAPLSKEIERIEELMGALEGQAELLGGPATKPFPLADQLVEMGIWPDTLSAIVDEFGESIPPANQDDPDVALAELKKRFRCVESMEIADLRGRHVFLGPPGAGKSTLAAKLATLVAAGGQRCVLISYAPDHPGERGRLEQIGVLGGFETIVAPDAAALRAAVGYVAEGDLILVDMPPFEKEHWELLESLENSEGGEPLLRHLVLAADGGWRGWGEQLARIDFLSISRCDLGAPLLPALELSEFGDYSLSFLSSSRGLDSGLQLAQPDGLLGTLIAQPELKADSAEAGGRA